jgi:Putative prokaryotic signal transducing protein
MNDHLVTVATFANLLQAELAKNRLEAEGIPAFLADVESTLALLAGNMSGVKVTVNERDARRATAVLAALDDESDAEPIRPLTEWICPHCDTEIEPGFDVCWSCGNPLQAQPGAFFAPKTAADPALKENITRTLPPSRPGSISQGPEDELVQDSEETVQVNRAWRAAVLGLFLCPPLLHIYAMCHQATLLGCRHDYCYRPGRDRYNCRVGPDVAEHRWQAPWAVMTVSHQGICRLRAMRSISCRMACWSRGSTRAAMVAPVLAWRSTR